METLSSVFVIFHIPFSENLGLGHIILSPSGHTDVTCKYEDGCLCEHLRTVREVFMDMR